MLFRDYQYYSPSNANFVNVGAGRNTVYTYEVTTTNGSNIGEQSYHIQWGGGYLSRSPYEYWYYKVWNTPEEEKEVSKEAIDELL